MDFQGFQHILPWYLLIPAVVGLILLSWASYRKLTSIPPFNRWLLILLRSTAFVLILLLFMNPYFYSSRSVQVKPKIAVFLDNSESIGIKKGNYNGLDSYQRVLNALNLENSTQAEIDVYELGEEISEGSFDSLDASQIQTNLSNAIQSILEMEEQVQAALLFSDGIITYGRNPTVNAFNSTIPIYTVALGDTTKVRDIAVTNVFTNPTGYTNTRHFIEAEISQSGFRNYQVRVELLRGSETLSSREISFNAEDQVIPVSFEHEFSEEGLQQFEIRTEILNEEWSEANNNQLFSVNVLDSKINVLSLAFKIHPDVKVIRSVIEGDISYELTTLTLISGNRFVEEIPENTDFDLIIFHGIPDTPVDLPFLNDLSEYPTLLFSLNADPSTENTLYPQAHLIERNMPNAYPLHLTALPSAVDHPVLELPEADVNEFPPLYGPLRSSVTDLRADPLIGISYEGIATDFPALAAMETGMIRRVQFLPWGLHRIARSPKKAERDYVKTLISNMISWASSDPDNRKLRISPSKQTFSTGNNPILNATLINERGNEEDDGIIEVNLQSEAGSSRIYNMENTGNGNYRLDLPRLSEGTYTYEATARKGERILDSQKGEFLVSNSSSELSNTVRNDELLRSISQNSGGSYFTYESTESLWDKLRSDQVLESRVKTVENYTFPVRSIFWFAVVLLLLTSEWLLRKYHALP